MLFCKIGAPWCERHNKNDMSGAQLVAALLLIVQAARASESIGSTEQFLQWASRATSYGFENENAQLTSDIYLDETKLEQPIGGTTHSFKGVFEGNNHTIYGLTLECSEPTCGLFYQLDGATVRNLFFAGTSSVVSTSLEGYAGILTGKTVGSVTIQNVHNWATPRQVSIASFLTADLSVGAGLAAGGLVGLCGAQGGSSGIKVTIERSSVKTTVQSVGTAGGLVGSSTVSLDFNNCTFEGTVKGGALLSSQQGNAGGLVGETSSTATILNCLTKGNVECAPCQASGFVGNNSEYIDIYNSANHANVTAGTKANGLAVHINEIKNTIVLGRVSGNESNPVGYYPARSYFNLFVEKDV